MDALYSARVILWCSMLSHCSKHRASGVVYHWRFDIGSGIRNDARVSIGAQRRGRFGAKEVSCIPFIPSRKMLVTPECGGPSRNVDILILDKSLRNMNSRNQQEKYKIYRIAHRPCKLQQAGQGPRAKLGLPTRTCKLARLVALVVSILTAPSEIGRCIPETTAW